MPNFDIASIYFEITHLRHPRSVLSIWKMRRGHPINCREMINKHKNRHKYNTIFHCSLIHYFFFVFLFSHSHTSTCLFHSYQIKHSFLSFSHRHRSTKFTGDRSVLNNGYRSVLITGDHFYSVFATENLTDLAFADADLFWGGGSVSFSRRWSYERRRRSLMVRRRRQQGGWCWCVMLGQWCEGGRMMVNEQHQQLLKKNKKGESNSKIPIIFC